MEDRELYKLSTKLNYLVNQSKHLLLAHGTRYQHFVDSGTRGFECSYARATSMRFHQDGGDNEVRELLKTMQEEIESTVRYLDQHQPLQTPAWLQELELEKLAAEAQSV
jgi:hypothetical protein